jgi:hypothetical protein
MLPASMSTPIASDRRIVIPPPHGPQMSVRERGLAIEQPVEMGGFSHATRSAAVSKPQGRHQSAACICADSISIVQTIQDWLATDSRA